MPVDGNQRSRAIAVRDMQPILDDIERALTAELFYVAVATALALPDVCGALEASNGTATRERYKQWWRKWLGSKYAFHTEDDVWSLRCGVVHNGSFGHRNSQFDRVVFHLPSPQVYWHNTLFKNCSDTGVTVLVLNPVTFCNNMVEAAAQWLVANEHDPNVRKNIARVVQSRIDGFPPCFSGVPVIA